MKNYLRLAAIPLCFGLLSDVVLAGSSASTATFNTFQYSQVGPITPLGVGEGSSITLSLTTQFDFSGNSFFPFSFAVTMTQGPGTLNVPVIISSDLMTSPMCQTAGEGASCLFEGQMAFEPGVTINPGTVFGVKGEIIQFDSVVATAEDTFTAASEPASLALMGLSLLAVGGFARRLRK